MSANYQAIEVVHQARVARFGASNCQIGSGPPVDAAQLAHFLSMQAPQRHPIEEIQQFLEPLPDCLSLFNETIYWHFSLPIADFQLPIGSVLGTLCFVL
jgi:hypothetical protein